MKSITMSASHFLGRRANFPFWKVNTAKYKKKIMDSRVEHP